MRYTDIMKSDFFVSTYEKIEEMKKDYPVNHGFVHIEHVVENAKELADTFHLTDEEKENLYVACVLHDVGYLNGRENHARVGAEIAKEYLQQNGFSQRDVGVICDAIACHGGKDLADYQSKVALCLVLADKLDFVSSRYNALDPDVKNFLAVDSVKLYVGDEAIIKIYLKDDINIEEFETAYTNRKLKKVLEKLTEALHMPCDIQYIRL